MTEPKFPAGCTIRATRDVLITEGAPYRILIMPGDEATVAKIESGDVRVVEVKNYDARRPLLPGWRFYATAAQLDEWGFTRADAPSPVVDDAQIIARARQYLDALPGEDGMTCRQVDVLCGILHGRTDIGPSTPDLTKLHAPLGLLDEVYGPGTAAALKAHGGPYVIYGGERWHSRTHPSFSPTATYRVAPPPALTQAHVPWEQIDRRFQWFAVNASGNGYISDNEPFQIGDVWMPNEGRRLPIDFLTAYRPGTVPWQDSKQRRPEGV
jgi:hypothetical protein